MFGNVFTVRMKTCMNISATIWPTLSVAKATRHSWLKQGCVFSHRLSMSYGGYKLETILDNPEVSRYRIVIGFSLPCLPHVSMVFYFPEMNSGTMNAERKVTGL